MFFKTHFQCSFLTFLYLVVVFGFTSCKKGEDDPGISFRSRKARVEGQWRLKSGNVVISTVDFKSWSHLNQMFDLNNSKFILTETGEGARPDIFTGAYFINIEFTKDGKFHLVEQLTSSRLEVSGEWNFNAKSANKKSKEYITSKITNVNSGKTSGFFLFNQSSVDFTYRIKELRNKIIVLEVESDIYVNVNNQFQQKYAGTYTFIQD